MDREYILLLATAIRLYYKLTFQESCCEVVSCSKRSATNFICTAVREIPELRIAGVAYTSCLGCIQVLTCII